MKRNILKLILCLIVVITLTGCSFVYNLEISDQIIEDNQILLDVFEVDGEVEETIENLFIKYGGTTDGLELYKKDFITRDNGLTGMNFIKEYSYDDYNYSPSIDACFENYRVVTDDNVMTIATSVGFQCFDKYSELEDVTINVTSKYKVVNNNADKISKGTYTWYIEEVLADDEQLMISVDLSKPIDELSFVQKNLLFIVICCVFIFAGIIYLIMKKRSDKVDKI